MDVEIEIVRRDKGEFALHDGEEYKIFRPAVPGEDNTGAILEGIVHGFKQSLTTYGAKFDEGKKIAGEFVLATRFSAITSFGFKGYDCVSAKVRDRTLGLGVTLAFREGDLAHVIAALRDVDGYSEGVLGARGSVFIFGTMKTIGAWPMRSACLVVDRWIVIGRQNDFDIMLRQAIASAELGLRFALKLKGWSR